MEKIFQDILKTLVKKVFFLQILKENMKQKIKDEQFSQTLITESKVVREKINMAKNQGSNTKFRLQKIMPNTEKKRCTVKNHLEKTQYTGQVQQSKHCRAMMFMKYRMEQKANRKKYLNMTSITNYNNDNNKYLNAMYMLKHSTYIMS